MSLNSMVHDFKKTYKNVSIRPLEMADIEFLRGWQNEPKNTKYLKKIPYLTVEMQLNWFKQYLDDKNEMIFAIEENSQIGRIVGSMSLYNFRSKGAEFGKILIGEPKAHGMNVGVNAICALCDIAKEKLDLEYLYLHVYKDNLSAVRVYEKVGFELVDEYKVDNNEIECKMSLNLQRWRL